MSEARVTRSSRGNREELNATFPSEYFEDEEESRPSSSSSFCNNSSLNNRRLKRTNTADRDINPASSSNNKKLARKSAMTKPGGRPAELYRTDLITAMKVNEDAYLDEPWIAIGDAWRLEWNQGVQIPVDETNISDANVRSARSDDICHPPQIFKLPKKLVCVHRPMDFCSEKQCCVQTRRKADDICRYDLDDLDVRWLSLLNQRRQVQGTEEVDELQMERVMEKLENNCYEQVQKWLLQPLIIENGDGRECDESTRCDICNGEDSDEPDEIVLCDGCDLAVHQSCYGVPELPAGQWLCRPCVLSPGKLPQCLLCPNSGGALKCSRSGTKWAHVSCVLWIPEVKFGNPEALEPIIGLTSIPNDRWELKCSICDRKSGACIQCSVKNCHAAYHVTCAQRKNQYMKISHYRTGAIGVCLVSYCAKHSSNSRNKPILLWDSPVDRRRSNTPEAITRYGDAYDVELHQSTEVCGSLQLESPRKRKAYRLAQLERYFYAAIDLESINRDLTGIEMVTLSDVFEYWKLKRIENGNRALLTPKDDEEVLLERYENETMMKRAQTLMKLRQNLEKARNLCYMVIRRERVKRRYIESKEEVCAKMQKAFEKHDSLMPLSQREVERYISYSLDPASEFEKALENIELPPISSAKSPPLPHSPSSKTDDFRKPPASPKEADEAGKNLNGMKPLRSNILADERASSTFMDSVPVKNLCARLSNGQRRKSEVLPEYADSSIGRKLRNREVAVMIEQ